MTGTHSEKRLIGYARVSTYGRTLGAQLAQLRVAGCSSRNIYREKVTGARADRRELLRMLDRLEPGDVVTVTRIDRLARSTFDLFAIIKRIVDVGGQFRSLAEPWADTGTSTGRLMLAVLGGLADVERDLIRTRIAEGRNRAKAQGKHMGRPASLTNGVVRRTLALAAGADCTTCRAGGNGRRPCDGRHTSTAGAGSRVASASSGAPHTVERLLARARIGRRPAASAHFDERGHCHGRPLPGAIPG